MVKCFTRVEIVPEFPLAGPVTNAIPYKEIVRKCQLYIPIEENIFPNFSPALERQNVTIPSPELTH